MKKQHILFLFPLLLLVSCGRIVKLSEEDYSWMPYKGNETLVFKSSTGETDTIFFIRKDTLWGLPDPALSTSKYEIAAIFCKHSDPYMGKNEHRYLESYFFEIKKTMSRKAELVVHLSAKDANFYHLSSIKIDSLSRVRPMPFATSQKHYDDVYIIEAEDYLGSFYQRSDFVTKLYWSKSEGLIRYDKKDGVYWELMK
ncbi:MAG: hypothetical protein KF829_06835 [Ferruginibacter sp.]|nr:hypothetical protein [Ferruginibacter sp.]